MKNIKTTYESFYEPIYSCVYLDADEMRELIRTDDFFRKIINIK